MTITKPSSKKLGRTPLLARLWNVAVRFARWMRTDGDARNTDAISEIPR